MIDSNGVGGFEVHCDNCPDAEEYDVDGDWQELMSLMKADGWKNVKDGDKWKHYCPECKKKMGLW